jgi:hypothetical protein
MKSVLWRVAKCLSYIEEARCLKVKCAVGSTKKDVRINTSPDNVFYEAVPCNVGGYKIAHADLTVHRITFVTRWIDFFSLPNSVWI